jgi:hypothetical protein
VGKKFYSAKTYRCNFSFIAQIFFYKYLRPVHLYFFPTCPF